MNTSIVDVRTQLFRVPLREAMSDARHGAHTHFELVTVTVRLADGSEGTGYSYTGGKGGRAIRAILEHELTPFLIGKDASDIDGIYEGLWWHIHYVGRGGITSFGMSAVDIALWDLKGSARARRSGNSPVARDARRSLIGAVSTSTSHSPSCSQALRVIWPRA